MNRLNAEEILREGTDNLKLACSSAKKICASLDFAKLIEKMLQKLYGKPPSTKQ